jgi:hypothetical protein
MTISMFWISHNAKLILSRNATIGLCAYESPHALMQYQFEQPVQALLAVIQARTKIGNDFVSPTFGSAKRFE